MIITEELDGPSIRDTSIARSCPVIEDFKVRPKSSWAGLDFGETYIADSFVDVSVTKKENHGVKINAENEFNSVKRSSKKFYSLDQGGINGDDQVRLNSKLRCSVPKNGGLFKDKATVEGEIKVGGHISCTYLKQAKMGFLPGPVAQVRIGLNPSQSPGRVSQKLLGQSFKMPVNY